MQGSDSQAHIILKDFTTMQMHRVRLDPKSTLVYRPARFTRMLKTEETREDVDGHMTGVFQHARRIISKQE